MKVWIEIRGDKRYHTNRTCIGVGDTFELVDLGTALDRGYTYCSQCRNNECIEAENKRKKVKRC